MTAPAMNDSSSAAVELFRELGYEIDLAAVDLDEWRSGGFDLRLAAGERLFHGTRLREVELLFLDSPQGEHSARSILEQYRSFNRILRPLVIVDRPRLARTEIHGWGDRHRPSRLDVPWSGTSREIAERLALLEATKPEELASRIAVVLSRESVSDRFFRCFSASVDAIEAEAVAHDDRIDRGDARSWATHLLSRILFLHFIQLKGWLDGDPMYVSRKVTQLRDSSGEIHRRFLEPLFFECLNRRPRDRTRRGRELGRIPYLNGGLFRRSELEETWSDLYLTDELISTIVRDLFERFPFTIREEDEEGVTIDPEMLGKVFESLMEKEERGRSGSFYTPKRVVDHLVDRAIAARLAGEDEMLLEQIRTRPGDIGGEPRRTLRERLDRITILDPACGSGAFLLSALRRIETLRRELGDETPAGILRQQIVERSLYGVDLKKEAVRLCELRLWLAVVAAREAGAAEIETVQPLPNLDRNILQGNSLLEPLSFRASDRLSVYREWRASVKARVSLTDQYRHSTGARRRRLHEKLVQSDLELAEDLLERAIELDRHELGSVTSTGSDLFGNPLERDGVTETRLRGRIRQREAELARVRAGELDFFAYDLHFASVMESGGFDLVVGNPPWVRGSKLPEQTRASLKERYQWLRPSARSRTPFPQIELSVAFLERALALTSAEGVVSMLVPSKLLSAFYASRCRREIERRHTLISIDDWSRGDELFDADTFPLGLTVRREREPSAIEVTREESRWRMAVADLRVSSRAEGWCLVPPEVAYLLRRLWTLPSLEESLARRPIMGVKTGANRVFFLDDVEFTSRGVRTKDGIVVPFAALCRVVRGRDVSRWTSSASTWMVWPDSGESSRWKSRLAKAAGISPSAFRLAWVRPEHLGWKVAWKDLARRVEAVVLPDSVEALGRRFPLVPNQTLYMLDAVSREETYLISAILNSSLVSTLASLVAEPAKDGHFRFFGRTIGSLPWPDVVAGSSEGRELVRLARAAHGGAEVQEALDRSVAKVYGVDERDRRLLESARR
jgi:hypothetical protein